MLSHPPPVFLGYSSRDESWIEAFCAALGDLPVHGLDIKLAALDGPQAADSLEFLEAAQVAVLFISEGLLTSPLARGKALAEAVASRRREGKRTVQLLVDSCSGSPPPWLVKLDYRPRDARPLSALSKESAQAELVDLAWEIIRSTWRSRDLEPRVPRVAAIRRGRSRGQEGSPPKSTASAPSVFISYSHRDEPWKDRLVAQLRVLELEERITLFEDRQIAAGEDWRPAIEAALERADVAVLLVSAEFLTSPFIRGEEVPRLLERRRTEGLRFVPVIVKPCLWDEVDWLASIQCRPKDARPLSSLRERQADVVLVEIAREIHREAHLRAKPPAAPEPTWSDGASQELGQALERAYRRQEQLISAGEDAGEVLEEILSLRRRIREGGQLRPGDFLEGGRFRLLDLLGRGGFSNVHKAFDRKTRQAVAVKVLHSQYAEDRSRRERFFRGARKMSELQHEGIVRVIEPECEDGGYHFFVMEYAPGGDLQHAVREGRIRDLEILWPVARALEFAHTRGIVHRDVKPANILLTQEGRAKLTDFDLVRGLDTTGGTRTGSALGTFLYMAPEAMHQAKDIGPAGDVYSFAMTAAFILHGQELPARVLRDPAGFFGQLDASRHVRGVLAQAASWTAEERPATATALLETLLAPDSPEEPSDRPAGPSVLSGGDWREEIEQDLEQAKTWEKRREVYVSIPERASDAGFALAAVDHLCRHTRKGGDLFWLEETLLAVAEKWPGALAPAEELRLGLYDHIPPPPEDLFRLVETREGRTGLWREIPAGRFLMGSPETEEGRDDSESPQHEVEIRSFEMAAVPVTIAQYAAFDPDHRSYRKKAAEVDSRPVDSVSWFEAVAFCRWLSRQSPLGRGARLPSEEEWEYACRAGTQTRFWRGEKEADLSEAGWYAGNSGGQSQPVGTKPANAWGLYDVHGNVFEWTASAWTSDYREREALPGARRVRRGGSWSVNARRARAASRHRSLPGGRRPGVGFRLSRSRGPEAEPAERGRGGSAGAGRGPSPRRRSRRQGAPAERPEWASSAGADLHGRWAAFEVAGATQRMRWIPPGTFWMGSPGSEAGRWKEEGPRQEVKLTRGFWLGETPCTQELWQAVMGENPSRFQSPRRPVERVSWEDCERFLEALNARRDGLELRLPTEAQWERACRADTDAATWRGDLEILGERNAPILDEIAWYGGNSGVGFDLENGYDSSGWREKQHPHEVAGTREVGLKEPNPWGLYDMLGNVWEWCADYQAGRYPGGLRVDPTGPARGAGRVIRGGSWLGPARFARAAYRRWTPPGERDRGVGFRLSRGQ